MAGCSVPDQPRTTFYSHGESVRVAPIRYCNPQGRECSNPNPQAVEDLVVPSGAPLQISVPEEVSAAPWQVVFRYRTDDGSLAEGRSPVFTPGQQHAYTLRFPRNEAPQRGESSGARLERVEVQRYSASLTLGPEGGVQFGIGGSWAVDVQPEPRTAVRP
ncbi:DUF2771 family protein [Haloactinomyces albus]|uniref:Uncharacterized protein n=1 Tax=Haloactinomyces albus TaxID=1352928 RepID=A0AAE4CKV3_9ACTN|nr:DUF2771 family protein [Haloactinomyces albus]MDR7301510.1 hypothetical protein [Haloactinomyces albus]